MAALGPLMKGEDKARAFAGAVMVILAIYRARERASKVPTDDGATLRH